jgi:hypothetical protein
MGQERLWKNRRYSALSEDSFCGGLLGRIPGRPKGGSHGALYAALAAMGVPGEWCNKRVVRGNCLISVKCDSWDEVYHFSKPAGWPKNRVAAGGRKAFNERLAANVYYQREHDERGEPVDINTIALLMELQIR